MARSARDRDPDILVVVRQSCRRPRDRPWETGRHCRSSRRPNLAHLLAVAIEPEKLLPALGVALRYINRPVSEAHDRCRPARRPGPSHLRRVVRVETLCRQFPFVQIHQMSGRDIRHAIETVRLQLDHACRRVSWNRATPERYRSPPAPAEHHVEEMLVRRAETPEAMDDSLRLASSLVTGVTSPRIGQPHDDVVAHTRHRITPSRFQLPPRSAPTSAEAAAKTRLPDRPFSAFPRR